MDLLIGEETVQQLSASLSPKRQMPSLYARRVSTREKVSLTLDTTPPKTRALIEIKPMDNLPRPLLGRVPITAPSLKQISEGEENQNNSDCKQMDAALSCGRVAPEQWHFPPWQPSQKPKQRIQSKTKTVAPPMEDSSAAVASASTLPTDENCEPLPPTFATAATKKCSGTFAATVSQPQYATAPKPESAGSPMLSQMHSTAAATIGGAQMDAFQMQQLMAAISQMSAALRQQQTAQQKTEDPRDAGHASADGQSYFSGQLTDDYNYGSQPPYGGFQPLSAAATTIGCAEHYYSHKEPGYERRRPESAKRMADLSLDAVDSNGAKKRRRRKKTDGGVLKKAGSGLPSFRAFVDGVSVNIDPWRLRPAPAHVSQKHAVIFDWDNTLLPSDFLKKHGYDGRQRFISYEIKLALHRVEKAAVRLVLAALRLCGSEGIFIVTSAEKGWVELSALMFMPRLAAVLRDIRIVSARSLFEERYPGERQGYQWKHRAMHGLLSKYFALKLATFTSEGLMYAIRLTAGDGIVDTIEFDDGSDSKPQTKQTKKRLKLDKKDAKPEQFEAGAKRTLDSAPHTPVSKGRTEAGAKMQTTDSFTSVGITEPCAGGGKTATQTPALLESSCVVSSDFECSCDGSPLFERLKADTVQKRSILQIGDSAVERFSVLAFSQLMPLANIKSVKMKDRPSPKEMETQLNLLSSSLQKLVAYNGHLDLSTVLSTRSCTP